MVDCTKRKIASDIIPRIVTASMTSSNVKPRRLLALSRSINIKLNLLRLRDTGVLPVNSQSHKIDSAEDRVIRFDQFSGPAFLDKSYSAIITLDPEFFFCLGHTRCSLNHRHPIR